MSNTTSWAFPNLISVTRNSVGLMEDKSSVINRVKLLLMTEPTELYDVPNFGVGLKKYMFQYNQSDNILPIIKDKLVEQLKLWEPYVDADATEVTKGLLYSGGAYSTDDGANTLAFTVMLKTIYGDTVEINIDDYDIKAVSDD